MPEKTKRFFDFGRFRLDRVERVLLANGHPVALTPKAFETLLQLLENSGHILEKDELLKRVWPDTFVEEGTLVQNISTLRKVLGDAPDGTAYIETIPRRGYRFAGAVREIDVKQESEKSLPPVPMVSERRVGKLRWILALGIAAVSLVTLFLVRERIWPRPDPAPKKTMLAVLPFENLSGDASQEYFSDGLTEETITQLGSADPQRLGVIARTSAMKYKNAHEDVQQIGRELGVDYVLEGSVRRAGDRIRISAQLIQVRDQTHLWAESYERDLHDTLAMESDVANAIAGQIELRLPPPHPRSRVASTRPINPEAYDLYLRGRYFWNERTPAGFWRGVESFKKAIEKDPNYAQAYAGLSDSYILLGPNDVLPAKQVYPLAKAAALRAVKIDDSLAEAHASLGFVKLLYDWNPTEAQREFRRAIELDPNYPTGHHWYAYNLAAMGRMEEALGEIRRAQELDPLSLIINTDVAQILFLARRYDEAITQCQKTIDLDPHFDQVYLYLGLLYEQKGMFDQAVDAFLKQTIELPTDPHQMAAVRTAYRVSGMGGFWQNRLALVERQSKEHYVSPYTFAVVYARMGDKEKTLENLQRAYEERYPSMVFVGIEPIFDNLRSDPRYAELLGRISPQP
jgi:TolB-like protein/DNA-binding winged helix-turn-helix (wHTH) protein/Flp pilus assembly protein TadD